MKEQKNIAGTSADCAAISCLPLVATNTQIQSVSQQACECCYCKSRPVALTPEQEAADLKRWVEALNRIWADYPQSGELKQ